MIVINLAGSAAGSLAGSGARWCTGEWARHRRPLSVIAVRATVRSACRARRMSPQDFRTWQQCSGESESLALYPFE